MLGIWFNDAADVYYLLSMDSERKQMGALKVT